MSVNKVDTLRQFCDVTGADEARSRFFLDSSNWQLEVALSSFYENGGNTDEAPPNPPAPVAASGTSYTVPPRSVSSPSGSPDRRRRPASMTRSSRPHIATLESLQPESSSDEEEGQAFYAGGSERSGQQIIGPGKGKKDVVTEMFKSVKERGAVVFKDAPSQNRRVKESFGGVGYRLGQTADDHEPVSSRAGQPGQEPARSVRLRLYREGFVVDSGPLREYAAEENEEFLSYIRRGEVPPELYGDGGEVRMSLEDMRMDFMSSSYTPETQVFTGRGHTLGRPTSTQQAEPAAAGPVPTTGPASAAGPAPSGPAPASGRALNLEAAQAAVQLADGGPVTTIQFRLADGSRFTGQFNHSHTVADLQQFVARAEPVYQSRAFALLTSYPSAELAVPTETLAQANILNSTLLLRHK